MSDVIATSKKPAAVVFHSENLEVLFVEGVSSYLLITFNEAGKPGDGRHIWGETLVRAAGITSLGFMTRSANWFPEADMHDAVEALATLLARFPERILFGHSMGGYGAIKYSRLLGSSAAISFCPQYSIKPDDVGAFDKRYLHCYQPSLHERMRISLEDVAGEVYIFYDPFLIVDRENVKLIHSSVRSAHLISMANTGHGTITAFRGTIPATCLFDLVRSQSVEAIRSFAASRRRVHSERAGLILNMVIKRHLSWAPAVWNRVRLTMRQELATWLAGQISLFLMQRGDLNEGRLFILNAIETFPNDARLLDSSVHLLLRAGNLENAIEAARRLIGLEAGNIPARLNLANILNQLGDVQAARAETLISLETDPHNIAALRMMASIERRLGNFGETIVWLRRAVAVQSGDVGLLIWLANTLMLTGAFTDAREVAAEASRIDPEAVPPLRLLADINQRSGDFPEAISALRRATLLAPNDLHIRTLLAHLLMQADALGEARLEAQRVLEVEPTNISVLRCMVEIARRANRDDEVAKWAQAVAKVPEATPENLEWAALMLIKADQLSAAQEVALSILGRDPSHAGALRCLADISIRGDKLAHAIVWARRWADGEHGNPERYYYLASLLMRSGDLISARSAILSSLALDPDHASALRCMADINMRVLETS